MGECVDQSDGDTSVDELSETNYGHPANLRPTQAKRERLVPRDTSDFPPHRRARRVADTIFQLRKEGELKAESTTMKEIIGSHTWA